MDKVTIERIATAHPIVREELKAIYLEASQALSGCASLRFAYVLRTPAEQSALYAQGRQPLATVNSLRKLAGYPPISAAEASKKVTNADAWKSMHNYGLAVDIVLIIDGKTASWDTATDFDGDKLSDWMEVVKVFKKHGWFWGGEFKSIVDKPHFEKQVATLAQLEAKRLKGDWLEQNKYVRL